MFELKTENCLYMDCGGCVNDESTSEEKQANQKWDKDNTKVFSIKITKKNFHLLDKFAEVDGATNVEKFKNLLELWNGGEK